MHVILAAKLKWAKILEENIGRIDSNHQQAYPNERSMDENGFESDHTGQACGVPLEA